MLTTRGGEACVPSIAATACDRDSCDCAYDHIAVDGMHTVNVVTIADLDVAPDDLVAACTRFLEWSGWDEPLGDDTAQTARELVAMALDAASDFALGARLRPRFDRDAAQWVYTPV